MSAMGSAETDAMNTLARLAAGDKPFSTAEKKAEEKRQPPFKAGDVVQLKSGGFRMVIVECTWSQSCSPDDAGSWSCEVLFAPETCDARGLIYDEVDAAFLRIALAPPQAEADMPF